MGVFTKGKVLNFTTDCHPGTNMKLFLIAIAITSIALSSGHLWARLFRVTSLSLIKISSTLPD